jgi:hypothetical protein
VQPEHCCTNFKFASPLVSSLLHKVEVYVNSVSCSHQHFLSVVGQTAHPVFHNHRWGYRVTIMTITQQTACSLSLVVLPYNHDYCYCVHLFSMCVITSKPDCPVSVRLVYPIKYFSYLLVVGQTAHHVFHNHRCGYRVTIMTVTKQTARGLSYNQRSCYRTTMMIVTMYTCSLLSSSSSF